MYEPAVARESTDTITPPWNLKANVVVPCANRIFTSLSALCPSSVYVFINSIGLFVRREGKRVVFYNFEFFEGGITSQFTDLI